MPTRPIPHELLEEAVSLRKSMSEVAAAALATNQDGTKGVARSTLQNRLKHAALAGLMGFKPVLPGFGISRTATQLGPDGELQREWIEQKPEHGEEFKVPDGHLIKGVSALIDPDNRVIAQWVKTREGDGAGLLDAIRASFDNYRGFAVLPPAPTVTNADLATVYNIADQHFGLYAWAREAGEPYDIIIGAKALKNAMTDLVARAPASEQGIVLNLGDFFHSDNNSAETARSHNALDVDSRYGKVCQLGVDLMIWCIELALQKHDRVLVRCLQGNHDEHSALWLSIALETFFRSNPRVTVDCDPSKFFWWQFGKVFIGAAHGDQVKPDDMPGVMASRMAKMWGETEHRYAYFGHVHHKSRGGGEKHGVTWETFQSLAAKDAWHSANGYTSGRSMTAITHHKQRGEVSRNTVSI